MDELVKQLIDQPLHLLWAVATLLPIVYIKNPRVAFTIAAIILDIPREFVDQWPIGNVWDTLLDLTFFALGGYLMGIMWERVRG